MRRACRARHRRLRELRRRAHRRDRPPDRARRLEPGEALLVSEEGPGSFDFTVWWELELELAGGERTRLGFGVPGNFPVCRHDAEWRHVPALGAEAWVLAPE